MFNHSTALQFCSSDLPARIQLAFLAMSLIILADSSLEETHSPQYKDYYKQQYPDKRKYLEA